MYPERGLTTIHVAELTDGLCGPLRPGHFDGVATVVTKLFFAAMPDRAYFGEKDYQQLQVVKRLARDLNMPIEVVACPTVREPDGLALSSRNRYLSAAERAAAPAMRRALGALAEAARAGVDCRRAEAEVRSALAAAGFGPIDYVAVVDAETLALVDRVAKPARALAAARLGKARLIDNVAVLREGDRV
jgi:pantoate--beta-alanine ligase